MTAVLSLLLSITRGALLTAGLILLVRVLFHKVLSAKAKYYLWLLLALRLVLPVVPESPVSLMNFLPDRTAAQQAPSPPAAPDAPINPDAVLCEGDPETAPERPEVPDTVVSGDLSGTPDVVEEFPEAPVAPAAPTAPSIPGTTILFWVWLAGVGLVLAVYGGLYLITAIQLKRLPVCADSDTLRVFLQLKRACGINGQVRLVSGGAGMLGGLLRPTIVLPVEKHGEDVAPIIVHELMHYKYKDLWIFAALRLLTAVYWFNPAVWLCFHFAKLDGEAACDQRVLETGLVQPAHYARALYEEGVFSMKKNVLMQTTFGGDRHSLKRRIRFIATFKRPRVWVTVLTVALAILVTACTITEAQSGGDAASSAVSADTENGPASAMDFDREPSDLEDTPSPSATAVTPPSYGHSDLDGFTYESTMWGMTPEAVLASENFSAEDFPLLNRGKNYSMDGPVSGHPEVKQVEFEFHFTDLELTLGLDRVQVDYDPELITYEELLSLRRSQFGPPTSTQGNTAQWELKHGWFTLTLTKNGFLREMTGTDHGLSTEDAAAQLATFDAEEYLSSLQPPNGHYGWTYAEHVEAGVLDPEQGSLTLAQDTEAGRAQTFATRMELGGETVDAVYVFATTMATIDGSGKEVLTQVMVTPPEGVALSQWVAKFSDSFTDKLYESQNLTYKSPLSVGSLLPEAQQEEIMNTFRAHNDGNAVTLGGWSLVQNWYQQNARIWHFNGTGAALYLTAQALE